MDAVSVKQLLPDRKNTFFNCAVWSNTYRDKIFLLGRQNNAVSPAPEPDISELVLLKLDNNLQIISEQTVWQPKYDTLFLEDPRIITINTNRPIVGMTCVLRSRTSFYPFGGYIEIADKNNWPSEFPNINLLESLGPGKDVTPIDERLLIFRPEGIDNYYQFQVIEYSNKQNITKHVGNIDFPKNLSWATWKMGTSMPPIWINENEALFYSIG